MVLLVLLISKIVAMVLFFCSVISGIIVDRLSSLGCKTVARKAVESDQLAALTWFWKKKDIYVQHCHGDNLWCHIHGHVSTHFTSWSNVSIYVYFFHSFSHCEYFNTSY